MKVDKVIEKFYFRLQLAEDEAELLLAILEKVKSNSKKFVNDNYADDVEKMRRDLYAAGVNREHVLNDFTINGDLTFPEF